MFIFCKLLCFLWCYSTVLAKIEIKNLSVPSSLENEEVDNVILDCDYDADEDDIVVKWFFNNELQQIYQWIPRLSKPQASGIFQDIINTTYKISDDETTMHRALYINKISTDISGNYTCKVSGYLSEDVKTAQMIIYDPPDVDLDADFTQNDDGQIDCSTYGVYPEPNLDIIITNSNKTEILFEELGGFALFDNETGLYNISTTLIFNLTNITNPFKYVCELYIPGTNYTSHVEKLIYLGNLSPSIFPSFQLLTFTMFMYVFKNFL